MILHITPREQWQQAQNTGAYTAPSLTTEGFIHCSTPEQAEEVANRLFAGRTDLVLLCIDPDQVRADICYENCEGGQIDYPHIYGPINLEAVTKVVDFPPDDTGRLSLPSL